MSQVKQIILRAHRNPSHVNVMSTSELCVVALWFGKMELAPSRHDKPLDALERLGPEWEQSIRALWRSGWRPEAEEWAGP